MEYSMLENHLQGELPAVAPLLASQVQGLSRCRTQFCQIPLRLAQSSGCLVFPSSPHPRESLPLPAPPSSSQVLLFVSSSGASSHPLPLTPSPPTPFSFYSPSVHLPIFPPPPSSFSLLSSSLWLWGSCSSGCFYGLAPSLQLPSSRHGLWPIMPSAVAPPPSQSVAFHPPASGAWHRADCYRQPATFCIQNCVNIPNILLEYDQEKGSQPHTLREFSCPGITSVKALFLLGITSLSKLMRKLK